MAKLAIFSPFTIQRLQSHSARASDSSLVRTHTTHTESEGSQPASAGLNSTQSRLNPTQLLLLRLYFCARLRARTEQAKCLRSGHCETKRAKELRFVCALLPLSLCVCDGTQTASSRGRSSSSNSSAHKLGKLFAGSSSNSDVCLCVCALVVCVCARPNQTKREPKRTKRANICLLLSLAFVCWLAHNGQRKRERSKSSRTNRKQQSEKLRLRLS